MSDANPPRVADVRPARVWQPSELMGTAHRPEGFVQHAWASSSSKNYWVQEVITETLLLKANKSSDAVLSEPDLAELGELADPVAESDSIVDSPVTEPAPTSEQQFTEEYLNKLRSESYDKGVEDSRERFRAEIQAEANTLHACDQAMVQSLQNALDALKASPQSFYEPLKRLALHLAEQLVLGELALNGQAIERLVQRCIDDLDSHSESVILVELNPGAMTMFATMQARVDQSAGPKIRLQADANLMPGSVRASANDAIVEDLIENRLEDLARDLSIHVPDWKKQSSFDPGRLAEMHTLAQRGVEDASPRMTSTPAHPEPSVIDELLGEDLHDA